MKMVSEAGCGSIGRSNSEQGDQGFLAVLSCTAVTLHSRGRPSMYSVLQASGGYWRMADGATISPAS